MVERSGLGILFPGNIYIAFILLHSTYFLLTRVDPLYDDLLLQKRDITIKGMTYHTLCQKPRTINLIFLVIVYAAFRTPHVAMQLRTPSLLVEL